MTPKQANTGETACATQPEQGFALLMVFVMAAVIAITLYTEMPRVAFESQRAKEQLLVDRGNEYKRAIQLFYRKLHRFPSKIDDLESTNNLRFLRRRFVDPMTGKDDWRLVHVGPGGFLTDSLVQKPNPLGGPLGSKDPKDQTADASQNPGGQPAQPMNANGTEGGGGINLATARRPSDTMVTGAPAGAGAPGGVPPADGSQNPQQPLPPQYAGGGQPAYPGQQPQQYPGQPQQYPVQPQQYPGQPQQYPVQPQQYPGQPQQYPVQPQQQYPGQPQQYPGQPGVPPQQITNPNGQQPFLPPGVQQILQPGQPGQTVQPGQPGQPPYPTQPLQPGQPGYPPYPAAQQGQPGFPQQPTVSFQPGQPYPNQQQFPGAFNPPGAALNATPNSGLPGGNAAIDAIKSSLFSPRQPPSGLSGTPDSMVGGGTGIAGVATTYKGEGIKRVNDRKKYQEWEFVYDLKKDKTVVGSQAAQQASQPQQPQTQSNPGFGTLGGSLTGPPLPPGSLGQPPVQLTSPTSQP